MDRKSLKIILEKDEEIKTKISKVLALHHFEINKIKSQLKTEEDVNQAVTDAIKNTINTFCDGTTTPEYKILKQEFDDYKYKIKLIELLKSLNVKDKFIFDVIAKIKKGSSKSIIKQAGKIKAQYVEFFKDKTVIEMETADTILADIHAQSNLIL